MPHPWHDGAPGSGKANIATSPISSAVDRAASTDRYQRREARRHLWHERMGMKIRFPADYAAFLFRCHAAGQAAVPPPLQYGPGDYNCLHQDLFGDHVFPLQVARPTVAAGARISPAASSSIPKQRPGCSPGPRSCRFGEGDAVVFAVNSSPIKGCRGEYRVMMRHGVSTVRSGQPASLGSSSTIPTWELARPAGFEPATSCLEGTCSIQLSYGRAMEWAYVSARSAARPNGRPSIGTSRKPSRAKARRPALRVERFRRPLPAALRTAVCRRCSVRRLPAPVRGAASCRAHCPAR